MSLPSPAVSPDLQHQQTDCVEQPVSSSAGSGRGVLVVLLLTAIAGAMGGGFWTLSRQLAPQLSTFVAAREKQSTTPSSAKSIAVLPFQNLSSSKGDAFLASGVQDDILTALAKIADLKVISRTSLSSYTA